MGDNKRNPNAIAKREGGFSGMSGGATGTEITALNTQYGHNGTHVVVIYNRTIINQLMTPAEVEDHIKAMQYALQTLRDHQAGLPPPSSARVISRGGEALSEEPAPAGTKAS